MKPKFGTDLTNVLLRHTQIVQTRLAGSAVIRVVNRCNDAKENHNLNLSQCQLCQVPDAVFHLMRDTPLTTCNLSGNSLSKIQPKFAINFSLIAELNISHNKLSKLPEELSDCVDLEKVDFSHNCFVNLPSVIFTLPKIRCVVAVHNFVMDVELTEVSRAETLSELDLRENPLSPAAHEMLSQVRQFNVVVTPRELEEWEDLTV